MDTLWLDVGHVDEIMSVQRTGADSFRVILASPDMAIEILESDPTWSYEATLWNWEDDDYVPMTAADLITEYRAANLSYQAELLLIKGQLEAEGIEVVEVPVFFAYAQSMTSAVAALPGMTNMLNVNGKLIVPEPFDGRFKSKFLLEVDPGGSSIRWIDCIEYHWVSGEVHCGTNTRRTPGEAARRWWEREPVGTP